MIKNKNYLIAMFFIASNGIIANEIVDIQNANKIQIIESLLNDQDDNIEKLYNENEKEIIQQVTTNLQIYQLDNNEKNQITIDIKKIFKQADICKKFNKLIKSFVIENFTFEELTQLKNYHSSAISKKMNSAAFIENAINFFTQEVPPVILKYIIEVQIKINEQHSAKKNNVCESKNTIDINNKNIEIKNTDNKTSSLEDLFSNENYELFSKTILASLRSCLIIANEFMPEEVSNYNYILTIIDSDFLLRLFNDLSPIVKRFALSAFTENELIELMTYSTSEFGKKTFLIPVLIEKIVPIVMKDIINLQKNIYEYQNNLISNLQKNKTDQKNKNIEKNLKKIKKNLNKKNKKK